MLSVALLSALVALAAARPHSIENIQSAGATAQDDASGSDSGLVADTMIGWALGAQPPMAFGDQAAAAGQEWVPVPVRVRWQNRAWCGAGDRCHKQEIPADAKLVNVDLFDTPAEEIQALRQKYIVTCYFSAGTYEAWRPDANKFTPSIKGLKMSDWDETWLDIRKLNELRPIMQARMDLAKMKGCHGVEPDNVDCWQNKCVPGVPGGDKGMYQSQLVFNRWLAAYAHSLGLNIGLKNNLDQVKDLVGDFDWAMNESCHIWNECALVTPFITAGKAVLATEYKGVKGQVCQKASVLRFSQKVDNRGMWLDC
eukprot:comp12123_c0_seq1/m.6858 comp12123_c0_seq1/g.6858  ORF comp12123_c0_seq1/g.6858 comp12123_c0_seq1/m.6858 type:complete len:311 (-) comp12123_c0_seq1:360-1292(-)